MKIEPGCKCIIINSKAGNDGLCVTAVKFVGEEWGCRHKDNWEIDTLIDTVFSNGRYAGKINLCSQSKLMRIDGYKDPEQSMDELVKISQEMGLYDIPNTMIKGE